MLLEILLKNLFKIIYFVPQFPIFQPLRIACRQSMCLGSSQKTYWAKDGTLVYATKARTAGKPTSCFARCCKEPKE